MKLLHISSLNAGKKDTGELTTDQFTDTDTV
jgi:hypothetical protein